MAERSVAHSFDCDGVLAWRIPIQADVLPWKRRQVVLPSELPTLNRNVNETPIGILEFPSYGIHAIRNVTRLAAWAIIAISQEDIYLNTGRENRRAYVDLTEASLKRAGIRDRFQDLFFGVSGISTTISKIVWLDQLSEQYDMVYHYDDNPKTALTVEKYFRERDGKNNVKSILVRDWSAGFLTRGIDLEKEHPNLVVARDLREAVRLAKN